MKVSSVPISRLRMTELRAFCERVSDMIGDVYEEGGDPHVDKFRAAAAAFGNALAGIRVSNSLAEADAQNDRIWMGLNHALKAYSLHLDPEVRRAAETVRQVFDQTPKPVMQSYDEEYGNLRILLERLEKLPAEVHAEARTAEWLDMLRQSLDNYAETAKNQLDADSRREIGINAMTHRSLIDAWEAMVTKIDAMLVLDLDENLPPLVKSLNALIDKTALRIKMRSGCSCAADDPDMTFDGPDRESDERQPPKP